MGETRTKDSLGSMLARRGAGGGQTWLRRWTRASSLLRPKTPRAMCLTVEQAVWRWTRSRSMRASSRRGATA